jgi:hypothetical protein
MNKIDLARDTTLVLAKPQIVDRVEGMLARERRRVRARRRIHAG